MSTGRFNLGGVRLPARLRAAAAIAAAALGLLVLRVSAVAPPAANTWSQTGDLLTARAGASATLLYNGLVLVTGGTTPAGVVASAERYNPATGTFVATAPMHQARANHTATLLADSRVLVTGGVGPDGRSLTSAEIFDPTANAWTIAPPMSRARSGHTATMLWDERVLIAGGDDGGVPTAWLEIFDPDQGSFTLLNVVLTAPRTGHAATLLYGGDVLIAGGFDGTTALSSIDLIDPYSNVVTAGPSLGLPRAGLTATTLLGGKVLLLGGATDSVELATGKIYDPDNNTMSDAGGAMAMPRQHHQAFLLPHNNAVLIVGGTATGTAVTTAELYVPWQGASGTFFPTNAPAAPRTWSLGTALSFPASLTIRTGPTDGSVLLAGGSASATATNPLKGAELYHFATVNTDKADYPPFTTVAITGSGWVPGETVTLSFLETGDTPDYHQPIAVVADQAGNFTTSQFQTDKHDFKMKFLLTATGMASQVQTSFTDGPFNRLQVLLPGESNDPTAPSGKGGTPTAQTAGTPFTITVNAVDASFNLVNTAGDVVAITSGDVGATLPANAALIAGTRTFSVTLNTAGNQTVTASDVTDNTKTGDTSTATVSTGAFTKLQLLMPGETASPGSATGKTGTPTAQTAGTPFNVTVNAVDARWNVVTSVTDTVGITSGDTHATLPANAALVAGTQTFSVTFKTAGVVAGGGQSVTASDVTDGTKTSNSSPLTAVNAAAFTKLLVRMPGQIYQMGGLTGTASNQPAGTAFTVTVYATDAYDNWLTTAPADSVHITSSDGAAVLAANGALNGGSKQFTLTLNTQGTATVTASDVSNGAINSGTSASITVTGSLVKLQLLMPGETAAPGTLTGKVGTPDPQTAGSAFTVTVNGVDANWNVVSSATHTINVKSNTDVNGVTPANAALVSGTKTFSMTLKTAGNQTVTATDVTSQNITSNTSPSTTVSGAAFTKLQILMPGETASPGSATGKSGQATTQTAGTPFNVTVNAVDTNWNVVNTVTDTGAITSSDVNAALPANAALVAGTGTFSVTFKTAGSANTGTGKTVTASDVTDGTKTANTSPSTSVNAGAFAKLQLLMPGETAAAGTATGKTGTPTAQTSGIAFNATVNGVDANWNIVTTATDTIATTSSDANATLPSNAALVSGTRVRSITFKTAGTYTVSSSDVTDGTKTAATGASTTVNPGAFTKLQILAPGETASPGSATGKTGTPTNQNVGVTFSLIVNAVDANWNRVSSVTDVVHFTNTNDVYSVLPADIALVGGTVTVSPLFYKEAEGRAITASDVTDGTKSSSTTAGIPILEGSFTKLQILLPGETAAAGSATGKTGTPTTETAGSSFSVIVNGVDAYFNIVSVTDTVSVTTTDTNGSISANAALVAGTRTFSATLKTVGTWTLSTTDVTDGTKTGNTSASVALSAGAFSKLQILMPGETANPGSATGKTGTPSARTAGAAFNVTVNAVDANWNLVSSATDTVAITSSDVNAALPANAALVSGTQTFSVTLKTAANKTVTASDATNQAKTPNTSPSTSVVAGAFAKLQILFPGEVASAGSATGKTGTPSSQIINVTATTTVNAVDANWNVVNTVTDTVTLSSTDPAATIPANAALVAGTKPFTVKFNTAGIQTFTVTDVSNGAITPNTSGNVSVSGAFTKLQVLMPGETSSPGSITGKIGTPDPQVAGTPFTVTVNAVDSNWYIVQTATDAVGLRSSDVYATIAYAAVLSAGTRTFSVTLKTPGSQTITVTDATNAAKTPNTGTATSVSAGAFAALQMLLPGESAAAGTTNGKTGSPSMLTAGTPFNVTVNAVDANWNVINSVGDTVALTTNDPNAVMPANTALSAGTQTFSVTLATGQTTFGYRKSIGINVGQITGSLTNFPLLFNSTDVDFRTVANGGKVTNVNGYDIVFRALDDTTCGGVGTAPCTLDHELVKYDGAAGQIIATVRVPTISSSTVLYVYLGNGSIAAPTERPTAVWDSYYKGVYHFADTQVTANDSTINGNHGAIANGAAIGAVGTANTGLSFVAGSFQTFAVAEAPGFNMGTGDFTYSMWFKKPAGGSGCIFCYTNHHANSGEVRLYLTAAPGNGGAPVNGGAAGNVLQPRLTNASGTLIQGAGTTVVDDNSWHLVHVAVDRTNGWMHLYVDGVNQNDTAIVAGYGSVSPAGVSALMTLASEYQSPSAVNGNFATVSINDLRISQGIMRSSAWIAAEYQNAAATAAFYTLGATAASSTLAFNLTSLMASDASDGTKTANTSLLTTVNEGAFSRLQVLLPGESAAPGTPTGKTGTPTAQAAGTPFTVTVNAVDAEWNPVTSATDTVAITSSDVNATLPANAALVAGSQTFSVTLGTAGSRTVTASDSTDGTNTANTSASVSVTGGSFAKLQLLVPGETAAPGTASGKTGTPTAQTAGASFNVTVNAVDANWNLVTSATDTVGITSSDANAALPSGAALVAGTQTFSVTLKTAGSATVTATDSTNGAKTPNTSPSTTVNVGAFVKLLLRLPGESLASGTATGKSGTPTNITLGGFGGGGSAPVYAVDANWNVVTSVTDTVHLTSTDTNGVMNSNIALVAGTRNLSFVFKTAGSQTMTVSDVTDGTKTSSTSSSVAVVAGTFTKLQILMPGETAAPGTASGKTGSPTAQTAGTSFNVTVNAVDANWNVASSTHTVAITSSDANATLPANAALVAGTQTVSVTLNTAGSRTVTASDVTQASITANTSPSTTVNVGAFAKLQLLMPGETASPGSAAGKTGTPTAQTAGSSFTVTVNAVDARWNVVTSVTDTVGITSSDANALLPYNVALVAGTKIYTVTLKTAGSRTVTATDITDGTKTANTSPSTTVSAGAFVKLQTLVAGETAAPGTASGKTGTPSNQTAGAVISGWIVNAVDANWNVVTTVTDVFHLSTTDPNGAVMPDHVMVAGTYSMTAMWKTAGSWTVTVSDVTDSTKTASTSPSITVVAGKFAKLQLLMPGETASAGSSTGKTGTPTAETAGTPFNVTVNAVDANWNRVSSVTDTVAITSGDVNAALPAHAALVAGTQTFAVTFKTSGLYTVTATDATDGTKTANTSLHTTVNAGAFAKIQLLMPGETASAGSATGKTGSPTAQTSGTAFNVTVNAVDANWNVASSTDTVAITSSDASATLPANAALVAGIKTFSVTLATLGSRTVTATDATDGTKTANTSSGTTVNAGAFAKLQILMPGETAAPATASGKTGTPTAQTAGSAFTVTVNAVDANWNVVSSTDTVAITSSDANATLPANAALVAGTKTFSVTLATIGSRTVTATDATDGTKTANTSPATTVNGGLFAKLQLLMPGESAAPGTASGKSGTPTAQTAGSAFNVTVSAVDANWNVVSSTDTVAITSSDANPTLPGNAALVAGTKTFSVTLATAASETVTASDATDGTKTANTSPATTVNAGSASQLVVVAQPTNTSAGASVSSVRIEIRDAHNNLVSGSTAAVSVSMGSNPGGGTLTGTTSVNAVAGVATFGTLSINKTGAGYTLAAASAGLTGATSTAFNITTSAKAQLAYTTQPSGGTGGLAFGTQPVVTVQDAFGNTVSADNTDQITLSLANANGATLGGAVTATVVNGVATFAGLSVNKAAAGYALTAASGALTRATSSAFTITVGPASHLSVSTNPSNATATIVFNTQPVVRVLDMGGNTVTGSTAVVTVAIAANPSGGTLSGTATVNAVAGVATFSGLSIDKTGLGYTLAATSAGLGGATTAAFDIDSSAPATLAITGSGVQTAATTSSLTVTALDAAGNIATTYTGTKTLTFSGANASTNVVTAPTVVDASGTAQAFGTPTAITFTNGVATVGAGKNGVVTLYKAETAAIAVTDGTLSATGAHRLMVTVGPAAATQLAFATIPAGVTAGSAFATQPVIAVEDTFGNTVTGSAATVALAIGGGSGTLSGTASIAAVNGVATYAGLSIQKAAAGYTLTATSAGLTSVTSGTFTVSPAAASRLVFATQPAGAIVGAPFGTQASVKTEDAFGNDSTVGLAASVTATMSIASGGGTLLGTTTADIGSSNNGTATFSNLEIDDAGAHTLSAAASGLTSATSASLTVVAGSTTTSVSNASVSFGQSSVVLRATVTGPGAAVVNEGAVTFTLRDAKNAIVGSPVTSSTVANGIATATFSLTGVSGGVYTIAAAYTDTVATPDFGASATTTAGTLLLGRVTPVWVNIGSPTVAYGTVSVTITGGLSAGSLHVPTSETVVIEINGVQATAPIQSDGSFSAAFSTTTLGVGGSPYQIAFSCAGDADFASTTDLSQSLAVTPGTVTVKAADASKVAGDPNPSLTVTYAGFLNGDSEKNLSTLPTVVTTATTSSPAGTYAILPKGATAANYTFVYLAGTLTVQPAPAADDAKLALSMPAALAATKTGAPSTPAPTGVAPPPISPDPPAPPVVDVGVTAPETDAKGDDSRVKTSTEAPTVTVPFGQDSVMLTATVKAVRPAPKGRPGDDASFAPGDLSVEVNSGSVTFTIETSNGTPVRTVTSDAVAAGEAVAEVSVVGLPVGNYSIRTAYTPGSASGAAAFTPSTAAAPGTLIVHLSATTIALSSSINPSPSGHDVTFTATVAPEAGGKPTGLVSFYIDGTTPIGTGALSVVDGQVAATFATPVFHEGTHEVTAEYQGDSGFTSSRSESAFTQRVTPAPVINLVPTDLRFVTQRVSTTSGGLAVRLSNIGDADLPVSIALSGPNAADFSQTNSCQASLGYVAPANACTILVTFHPSAAGVRSADLTILDGEGKPQVIMLTGDGN